MRPPGPHAGAGSGHGWLAEIVEDGSGVFHDVGGDRDFRERQSTLQPRASAIAGPLLGVEEKSASHGASRGVDPVVEFERVDVAAKALFFGSLKKATSETSGFVASSVHSASPPESVAEKKTLLELKRDNARREYIAQAQRTAANEFDSARFEEQIELMFGSDAKNFPRGHQSGYKTRMKNCDEYATISGDTDGHHGGICNM